MRTTLSSSMPRRRAGAAKVGLLALLAVGVAAAAVPAALVAMKNNETEATETVDGATVGAPSQFSAGKGGPTHVAPDGKRPGAIALEKRGFDAPPGRAKDGGGEPVDPLAVVNECIYPTRIAEGPGGKFYVTDAKVGSVFIFDGALQVTGELKGLDSPLGVAVGEDGRIYVGNDGRDNIEVYSPEGAKLGALATAVQMPIDMAFDAEGNLYVADSRGNAVRIFDATGQWIHDITSCGGKPLKFPAAVAVAYRNDPNNTSPGELYIGDQVNARVVVTDLAGNFLRAFGTRMGVFGSKWQGKFVLLQSLAVDSRDRVHALDCYLNKVQIFDAETGAYLDHYGEYGPGAGQLRLPSDIWITPTGQVAVTNSENKRVEFIYSVPPPPDPTVAP